MNFKDVKSITLPEGEVKSLSINGVEVFKKQEDFNIEDYEINEDLAIKNAQFRTTRVTIGKSCSLSINSVNRNIVSDFIIIDNLTKQLVTIKNYSINHEHPTAVGDVIIAVWVAQSPSGMRYFTAYLLDDNGKRSPEGVTVSINYR